MMQETKIARQEKPPQQWEKVQVEQGVVLLLFDQILSSSMKRPERMIINVTKPKHRGMSQDT